MMSFWVRIYSTVLTVVLVGSASVAALAAPPACMDGQRPLSLNNRQVVEWKRSVPNQWKSRGFVEGLVLAARPDHSGHDHFILQIGPDARRDVVEIVYNQEFGALPPIQPRMQVIACGDFINSKAPAGHYPASPAGAIIHWVHFNPRNHGHEHGFLMIDGVLYGNHAPRR